MFQRLLRDTKTHRKKWNWAVLGATVLLITACGVYSLSNLSPMPGLNDGQPLIGLRPQLANFQAPLVKEALPTLTVENIGSQLGRPDLAGSLRALEIISFFIFDNQNPLADLFHYMLTNNFEPMLDCDLASGPYSYGVHPCRNGYEEQVIDIKAGRLAGLPGVKRFFVQLMGSSPSQPSYFVNNATIVVKTENYTSQANLEKYVDVVEKMAADQFGVVDLESYVKYPLERMSCFGGGEYVLYLRGVDDEFIQEQIMNHERESDRLVRTDSRGDKGGVLVSVGYNHEGMCGFEEEEGHEH